MVRHVVDPPSDVDLAAVAAQVDYIGSPEHKDMPTFAGMPKRRANASICPRELADKKDVVVSWLREAIREGAVGAFWESGFPRYVWYVDGDRVYEARLVNRGLGQYKGFPLNDDERPRGLSKCYG